MGVFLGSPSAFDADAKLHSLSLQDKGQPEMRMKMLLVLWLGSFCRGAQWVRIQDAVAAVGT